MLWPDPGMWKPCIGTPPRPQPASHSSPLPVTRGAWSMVFIFCARRVFPFVEYSICTTVTLQFTKSNWAGAWATVAQARGQPGAALQ